MQEDQPMLIKSGQGRKKGLGKGKKEVFRSQNHKGISDLRYLRSYV